ncbi:transposase [Dyadobacter sp. NIV53]|uniref:transposase n=1 Tax=Dyadobacter sp. NIV53 TaxID=2861765 RepID=UPI001C88D029|nr:transposase [Dyadobacter sp. NIV53]
MKQDYELCESVKIWVSPDGYETNGFELIRNKKQLSSYAGFDVKEKQSGTSIKGKPRISKKEIEALERPCISLQ